jgi:hypothetical protein
MTAAAESPAPETGTEGTQEANSETPTATPEVDWKAKAREWEKRAKENSDAARRLAALEDANKTEAQRLTERATAAEAAAAQAAADSLRWRIATRHGISDDLVDLYLTGTDEDTLTRQAEGLAAFKPAPPADGPAPFPRPDLSQGARSGTTAADPAQQFAHFLKQRMA